MPSPAPGSVTPLPLRPVLSVTFNLFVAGVWSSSIYPYLPFMVVDTGAALTLSEAGYYAGVLASAYYAGCAISSVFWGTASDRLGRRPVMLFCVMTAVLSSFLLGLTRTSFWWAVAVRGGNGLLNGSIGVGKSVIGELTDSTNQAKAFGYTGAAWGAGTILGASLGGLLARPADSGLVSRDSLFGYYPYLLPNLVASVMYLIGWCFIYKYLPETRIRATSQAKAPPPAATDAEVALATESHLVDDADGTLATKTDEEIDFDDENYGPRTVFHSRPGLAAVMTYTILGSVLTCFEEVLPLFMVVPVAGLDFSSSKIGVFNLMMGLFVLIGQLLVWPVVARRATYHLLYYTGAFTYIAAFALLPLTPLIQRWSPLLWAALTGIALLVSWGENATFSSVFCLIANSVPSRLLGATNGLAQALVAIGRSVAPLLAGNIFALSMKYDVAWLPWAMLMLGGVCFTCVVFTVPNDSQRPLKERRAEYLALRRLKMKLPS